MGVKLVSASGGSVEINPPATASNFVATMPAGTGTVAVQGASTNIVSGTSVTASGSSVDFTGIPSWVKRITVMFSGVSTSGTSSPLIQLGDSGGFETTGYDAKSTINGSATSAGTSYTTGFGIRSSLATNIISGPMRFEKLDGNTWVGSGVLAVSGDNTLQSAGVKTLSDTLTQVRITTVNGTDAFDAGTINIMYE